MPDILATTSKTSLVQESDLIKSERSATARNVTLFHAPPIINLFEQTSTHALESDENKRNHEKLIAFSQEFTPDLIELIKEVDFEYGVDTVADVFLRSRMQDNVLYTKTCLNDTFLRYYSDPLIQCGILRLIARFDYLQLYPEGPTIALAALSCSDTEVQECGIRAFEHCATPYSLNVLANTKVDEAWLQQYIEEVVDNLKKDNVSAS